MMTYSLWLIIYKKLKVMINLKKTLIEQIITLCNICAESKRLYSFE
jgi:hypothetical protein